MVQDNITACHGETVLVDNVSISNYSEINWTTTAGGELLGEHSITPTYVPTGDEEGTIELVVTVTGNGICSSQTVTKTVVINYIPEIVVDAGQTDTVIYDTQATLSASVQPSDREYNYYWTPTEMVVDPYSDQTSTVSLQEDTELILTVTDVESGCQVTDSVIIRVEKSIDNVLNIRNGISPNGDGDNDIWYIEGIEYFPKNKVVIFNRWGDKIIEFKGYDNTNVYWDGKNSNGKKVPDGTYYYILEVSNSRAYTGWIQVRDGQ